MTSLTPIGPSSMPRARRRAAGVGVALAAALLLTLLPAASATDGSTAPAPSSAYAYDFISMPDFLNADIGDVRRSKFYRPGAPNSTNPAYEAALATVLDTVAAEGIRDVLVAGDLVHGHWGRDDGRTGTFGPVRTNKQRIRAARRAGDLYYGQWVERFAKRGLRTFAGIGDHEIGDDPWFNKKTKPGFNPLHFKWQNFHRAKRNFSKNVLQGKPGLVQPSRPQGQANLTAYAFRPHPEVQVITLDVFKRTRSRVVASLDRKQMVWLKRTLFRARADQVDWVIVQGHTPILGPVRRRDSSGIYYRGGEASQLWRVLKRGEVDFYLHGEMHDTTAVQQSAGGVVQVGTGGVITNGSQSYTTFGLDQERASLEVREFDCRVDRSVPKLWQTETRRSRAGAAFCDPGPATTGTMQVSPTGNVLERSGSLDVYAPAG